MRPPDGSLHRRQTVAPMTTIRILDELRLAEARFVFEEQLTNMLRTADQDAGRASEIESDDVSVARGQVSEEAEHVRLPGLVIEPALTFTVKPGGRRSHQSPLLSNLPVLA